MAGLVQIGEDERITITITDTAGDPFNLTELAGYGFVLFYQDVFEEKRFQFGISYHRFNLGDQCDHSGNPGRMIGAGTKIRGNPGFKLRSLAHIKDMPLIILHKINTRLAGKVF